jgi:hypothetical protein
MPAPEPGPEWVLSGAHPRLDPATESELSKAARSAWPKALADVRQVQSRAAYFRIPHVPEDVGFGLGQDEGRSEVGAGNAPAPKSEDDA